MPASFQTLIAALAFGPLSLTFAVAAEGPAAHAAKMRRGSGMYCDGESPHLREQCPDCHGGERRARHRLDADRFAKRSDFEHDCDGPLSCHCRDFVIELPNGPDEIGHRAVVDKASVLDFHATQLHAPGLDHERLTFPFQGLDASLTGVDPAHVVRPIFA